jgi:Uma2 family endonuclease
VPTRAERFAELANIGCERYVDSTMAEAVRGDSTMTFERASRLDPDAHAGEIDAGRWVPVTKNTWSHGEVLLSVGLLLRRYAKDHPGWSVSAGDPGTKLLHNPDVLRGPDVGVVRSERKPSGEGAEGWLEGAPDLAVEILGGSQSASELTRKALEYLSAGGRMVWILDPGPRRVLVLTPPNHVRVLGPEERLQADEVLPGFSCKVSELFEA